VNVLRLYAGIGNGQSVGHKASNFGGLIVASVSNSVNAPQHEITAVFQKMCRN
jgi:hypothetical protein